MNMARKIFTPEQEKKICSLYRDGVILSDIESKMDVNRSTIMRILKRNNEPLRGKGSVKVEQKVIKLYKKRVAISKICEDVGISSSQTIYKILKSNEIELKNNKLKK